MRREYALALVCWLCPASLLADPPAAVGSDELSAEFLEFLGTFEDDAGNWLDPNALDDDSIVLDNGETADE